MPVLALLLLAGTAALVAYRARSHGGPDPQTLQLLQRWERLRSTIATLPPSVMTTSFARDYPQARQFLSQLSSSYDHPEIYMKWSQIADQYEHALQGGAA